jgi:exopolysaccharide biosynthesis protein
VDTPFNGKVLEVLTTGHAQPTPTTVLLAANHDITLPEIGPQSPVTINSTLLNHKGKVTAAVGGGPRIVHQGNNTAKADTIAEKVGKSFSSLRHPRTAVGISKDRETMWWVIADGRRPDYSVGVSLPDFAEHMIRYGAYEAINLDGGGSSSMVVEGEVVNWPSDKTARPVANTIHLVRKK